MPIFKRSKRPKIERYHNLSDVKEEIRTGDILGWRVEVPRNLLDVVFWLYHLFTGASLCHVAIAAVIGDRVYAVYSSPTRVRLIPIEDKGDFYLIRTNIPQSVQCFSRATKYIGHKFSIWEFVSSLFSLQDEDHDLYGPVGVLKFLTESGYLEKSKDEFDGIRLSPDDLVNTLVSDKNAVVEIVINDKGSA